jgi:hypothetical protein
MKKHCLLLFLGAALLGPVADADPRNPNLPENPPAVSGTTNVTVPTTASELAAGYAIAIPQMTLKSIVIFAKSEGKIVAIRGVRSAKAMGAVLLIEFSAGDRLAINAENIVMITDGSRTP